MIDYFFMFANEAAAKADPVVQANMDTAHNLWRNDYVLINVTAKRISTGNPIAGFFCIVALGGVTPILLNHSALQFALDRDGPPYVVKNNIGAVITDVAVSPIFAGSHYPIAGF